MSECIFPCGAEMGPQCESCKGLPICISCIEAARQEVLEEAEDPDFYGETEYEA